MMQFPRFSSSPSSNEQKVRRLQFGCAILLTLLSIALHGDFMLHGYALWRDEVNSVGLATMPTLRELWASLSYDSSPVLWPLMLRGWIFYGLGDSDFSLRIFGFLMQMLLLAALWFNARALGQSAPVLSLFLVGCQPAIVLWPSLRSYGLGAALILWTFGSLWKALENPTRGRVAATFLLALLSVQCVYVNLILLAAICVGGIAVCLYREQKRRAILPCAVFAVAASSLLIYIPTLSRIAQWQDITVTSIGFGDVLAGLLHALSTPAPFLIWVWGAVAAICIVGAVFRLRASNTSSQPDAESDKVLIYCYFAAVSIVVGMILFLQRAGRVTYDWHYVAILVLIAVCLDSSWIHIIRNYRAQSVLTVLVSIVALTLFPLAWNEIDIRRTNLDLMAVQLKRMAQPNDLIVVAPFQYAITYQRYDQRAASWVAGPDVRDLKIHRYDLLKALMQESDSMRRVEKMMITTLNAGHRIWLVGSFPPPPREEPHYVLPKGYQQGDKHRGRYENYCISYIAYVVEKYAVKRKIVTPASSGISRFERTSLEVVQGFKTVRTP